ncbi:insulin growth factor-like family member 3 [Microtus ochrogaster]|uniref:Insulin growth factor-like family member 3 n=1 Tax=Microtus ochrogaster TaxID=79684 RepID=A0ABM0LR33_MICOH|nr:insulin growth factor-like family member 3 [Microtus ochrogaster]
MLPVGFPYIAFIMLRRLLTIASLFLNEAAGAQTFQTPSNVGLWLCQEVPRCGDRIYNPSEGCCVDDAILSFNQTRKCGSSDCPYWPCFELCCPESFSLQKKFIIKLKLQGERSHCNSSPISGDCAERHFHGEDIQENNLSLRQQSDTQNLSLDGNSAPIRECSDIMKATTKAYNSNGTLAKVFNIA